jgi:hypothetical protein
MAVLGDRTLYLKATASGELRTYTSKDRAKEQTEYFVCSIVEDHTAVDITLSLISLSSYMRSVDNNSLASFHVAQRPCLLQQTSNDKSAIDCSDQVVGETHHEHQDPPAALGFNNVIELRAINLHALAPGLVLEETLDISSRDHRFGHPNAGLPSHADHEARVAL